uniref:Uncharacterized protein n=1 Tax=Romanomermis culicivorax TaxID=13658 RepID=A0A915HS13_ROMCU
SADFREPPTGANVATEPTHVATRLLGWPGITQHEVFVNHLFPPPIVHQGRSNGKRRSISSGKNFEEEDQIPNQNAPCGGIRHKTQAETPKSRKRGCISPNEFIDFDETPPKAGYSAPKPTPSSNRKRPIVRGSFRTVSQASDDSVPLKHFTLENELSTSNFDETDTSRKVTTSKSYFCEKALMNRLQQLSEADQSLNEADDQDVIKSQNLSFDSTANYDQDARSFIGGLLPLTVDTQITTTIADPEPPDLQIMVSDSELWLINERNANKQKLDDLNSVCNNNNRTSSDNNSKDDIQSAPDAEIPTEGSVVTASASLALSVGDQKKNSNDVKLPILNCLDVVITDVKAHDYSVVIKECYSMPDFAVN